jgi:hypothetical protein
MTAPEVPPAPPRAPYKVQPRHRDRLAIVYVRQSTPQQVVEHRESAALQYQLRQRAVELGWPASSSSTTTRAVAASPSRAGPASSACWPRSASTTSGSSSAAR